MAGLWQIRLKLDASDPSNLLYNMFGYVSLSGHTGDEAADLNTAFQDQMTGPIQDVLAGNTFFINTDVIEVNDPARFNSLAYATLTAGARSGDPMPRFVAWKYQLTRAVRGQRHGYKRFGAISEADVTAGIPNAGVLTALEALRVALKAPLTFGAIDFWFPVILVRPVPPATTWTYHEFTAAQVQGVTTQNTRKR